MSKVKVMTDAEVMAMLRSTVPASREIDIAHQMAQERIQSQSSRKYELPNEETVIIRRYPAEEKKSFGQKVTDKVKDGLYFGECILACGYLKAMSLLGR